jgi:hypothetical protein
MIKKIALLNSLLFSLWPVAFLLSINANQFWIQDATRSLIMLCSMNMLLFFVALIVTKSYSHSSIIVSIFWIFFFFSSTIISVVFSLLKFQINGVMYLLSLTFVVVIFLIISWRSMHWSDKQINFSVTIFFVFGMFLVIFPIFNTQGKIQWSSSKIESELNTYSKNFLHLERPDIFYIILDGYGRSDILEGIYNYDNSNFTDWLKSMGFYVGVNSSANYPQTHLSMASSLNGMYLCDLAKHAGIDSKNRNHLRQMISNNSAAGFLKNMGYTYISFSSGYLDTEMKYADVYFSPLTALSEFENGIINISPLPKISDFQFNLYRKRILYNFEKIAATSRRSEPVFVVAHIIPPHHPFVFDKNGKSIRPRWKFSFSDDQRYVEDSSLHNEYKEQYVEQLIFANTKIKQTIKALLSNSNNPVIILQSDHGPGLGWGDISTLNSKERFAILNAYYLPDKNYNELYPSISPVNSFRLIFNKYFNTKYDLLEDRSFFSTWTRPYDFFEIMN